MKDASPWIALYAALVATGSAVWQLANYALTGGRIKVTLKAGAMNMHGMVTMPPKSFTPDALADLTSQGYPRPIVAVEVANVGRQPVTVTRWTLSHARGIAFVPVGGSIGKPLPCRLEVGQAESWAVDLEIAINLTRASESAITSRTGFGVHGEVELADGRKRRTPETLHL